MSRPKPSGRSYGRLTRHERNTVERMLDRNRSAREIAAELGRSPSTVTREVAAHRYVVSVNILFTIFTNVFSPIAPTRMRRIRQRGCAAFGV